MDAQHATTLPERLRAMLGCSANDLRRSENLTMRMIRVLPAACIVLSSLVCSCQKNLTAEAIEKSAAALVQRGPRGASTWIVAPDGVVNATLKTPDGQPVTQPVTGTRSEEHTSEL